MRVIVLIFFLLLMKSALVSGLACDGALELPADRRLSLSELQTMQPADIVQCLAHLGREELPSSDSDFIWKSIVKYYEGIANIPDSVLMLLHWVTVAVPPEAYANITFNNIDVIQNFGLNYNLNDEQISAIADRVREDFGGKEPEDYTYYDLTALRQILCAFNRSEIERIHPVAYREAAILIGKLEKCKDEPMLGFATLAVQKSAFGSPNDWTEATIKTIGKVIDYLPKEVTSKFLVQYKKENKSNIFLA